MVFYCVPCRCITLWLLHASTGAGTMQILLIDSLSGGRHDGISVKTQGLIIGIKNKIKYTTINLTSIIYHMNIIILFISRMSLIMGYVDCPRWASQSGEPQKKFWEAEAQA